jgi:hypothetical protein
MEKFVYCLFNYPPINILPVKQQSYQLDQLMTSLGITQSFWHDDDI